MSAIVKLTYPKKLVSQARSYKELAILEHDHHSRTIAQTFVTEWSMIQKDLIIGFVIAGLLATFIPNSFWQLLFLNGIDPISQTVANAVTGPLIAVLSFVCSIGNVPLAAVLWSKGMSFGGVIAFLYADLIVLPLLDIYRRYYGLKMASYIGMVFFLTMSLTGAIIGLLFLKLNLVPNVRIDIVSQSLFSLNYTFWLNLIFGALALYFVVQSKRSGSHSHH